jgi:DNA-binding Xre family transcriptional regulator
MVYSDSWNLPDVIRGIMYTIQVSKMNTLESKTSMIRVRIRELREQNNLSQEAVVYRLNCLAGYQAFSVSGYRKIEKEVNSVNLYLLDKLCQLYECGVQDILVRE